MPAPFRYPTEITGFNKLYSLLKGVNHPLEVISRNHRIAGDHYFINASFADKKFIFSQDQEFVEYILKQNQRNYYKSEIQSVTLRKYLGKGLLTNNGKDWLQQRRLIQPGFSKAKISNLVSIMDEEIDRSMLLFKAHEETDLYHFFHQLAFDIVAKTLFSSDIDQAKVRELGMIITEIQEVFTREVRLPFYTKAMDMLWDYPEKHLEK
ncbi:cytochrome P450 [Chryseobacterium camelliae]|uniref:Cytochrome P450 n=1 Tax=Chryseobacterium camelliae TaxID=1265445 RepID=A0ABU0TJ11_9FLAO|nr:cytochrome P450 [Chryseobacterium camelliae]MDQ1097033.1 cytochrome P450 [Chryseobacterium camelliae]